MARRNLLAISQIPEFSNYLERHGWTVQELKGIWEVLRATRPHSKTIVIHCKSQTMRGGETQHASIQHGCPSGRLVHARLAEKRRGRPDGG